MDIQKWNKKDEIFKGLLDNSYKGIDSCYVYYIKDKGYAVLNLRPSYGLYKRLKVSEIQDIFVIPKFRRQGVAENLIRHCEDQTSSDFVGISVPVSPVFGAAQRLYYKLGYEPDGNGVTYNREPVQHESLVKLDDSLCLMMIKKLNAN